MLFIRGVSCAANSWRSSTDSWLEAISVEWMLSVTSTTVFPSATSGAAASGVSPYGCASACWISLYLPRFLMFSSEEMIAMMNGLPRVDFPSSSTMTLSEASSTVRK